MNRAALLALGMTALAPAVAAQRSQDELKERYEHKLELDFIEYGGWITDYDVARKKAEELGKPIFVYFTRSYAP